jgi:hypothetical protein
MWRNKKKIDFSSICKAWKDLAPTIGDKVVVWGSIVIHFGCLEEYTFFYEQA